MYTVMIIVITSLTWLAIFGIANRVQRINSVLSRRVDKVEGTLEGLIDAICEDAEAEYGKRIETMFNFLAGKYDDPQAD